MAVARAWSIALTGMRGALVDVEADITANVPALVLIGLPDASLNEARERVRSASQNTGCPLPARRLTINLSPAALPKHGSGFDLSIAVVAAAAAGVISPSTLEGAVFLGELSLDGRLRPITGILPAVRAAATLGVPRVFVPSANVSEAQLVPGIDVIGVTSLAETLRHCGANLEVVDQEPMTAVSEHTAAPTEPQEDLSDIVGHLDAIEALITAAAGGHHMLLLGPPGAGKTMLARRLPGILPPLTIEEALEVAAINSLSGSPVTGALPTLPPWQAPHHTATAAALAGGGGAVIRPGAIARASGGVLFLDEAPEFARTVLDVLRQPLESGEVTIHRASSVAHFPARFQLVLAANPCPCGQWGAATDGCECPPLMRRRYLGRLSGPLRDRVDIQLWIPRVTLENTVTESAPVSSADARERVCAARNRALHRLQETPWTRNADVPGSWLRKQAPSLSTESVELLQLAVRRGTLSMRGADRVLRLSWTLADLENKSRPDVNHVRRAIYLRKGLISQ